MFIFCILATNSFYCATKLNNIPCCTMSYVDKLARNMILIAILNDVFLIGESLVTEFL